MRPLLTAVVLWVTASVAFAAETPDSLAARAFEDAQMATSSRTAVSLSQAAARLGAGDPDLAELVRRRQEVDSRFRAVDAERARALGQPGEAARRRAVELQAISGEAAAEAARLDQEIAARFPAYADLTSPAPLPLSETRALLARDEALVLIVPAADGTYIWAVRADRSVWARGEMDADAVAATVATLRAALDPGAGVRAAVDASGMDRPVERGLPPFPRAAAHALYRSVWAPVEPVLKGARTVYVVQAGSLSALPLSVLPTRPPRGDDADPRALRATPWLFTRHALATLPAVSSLRAVRRAPDRSGAASAFAGFGDPALEGDPAGEGPRSVEAYWRSGAPDLAAIKSLPRLPGSAAELKALARALRAPEASVVTGAAATEAAVRSADLSATRVVAFATHGLLAGEIGGVEEPALVLTPVGADGADDGLLTASEAAGLHLAADWVVLSACNTAAGDGKGGLSAGGEGLSGLARAFFHAGARALLVSHWRVRDDLAAQLTTATIEAHARNPRLGRAGALQAAMKDMLRRGDPAMVHPSAWAPFVVAGEGR